MSMSLSLFPVNVTIGKQGLCRGRVDNLEVITDLQCVAVVLVNLGKDIGT